MHPMLASWIKRRTAFFGAVRALPLSSVAHATPRRDTASVTAATVLPIKRAVDAARLPAIGHRRLRMRVDPSDHQRTLISGRMSEVCDALDALISRQQT